MSNRFKLSHDFWLHEFLISETAARMGRALEPDAVIIGNLQRLAETVLQPLRDAIMTPISISSGWRADWLNKAIGGSKTSAHMDGCAADCNAIGMTPYQLCAKATQLALPFDQIIFEFDSWMHISVAKVGGIPRGEVLTARKIDGKTVYMKGLVQ